jgi:hypothetical protein
MALLAVAERGMASRLSALIAMAEADDTADPLDDYIEAQVHGVVDVSQASKPWCSTPATATRR